MANVKPTEPAEYLEITDGQYVTIKPTKWNLINDTITPKGSPPGTLKDVQNLTIYYEKPAGTPGVNFYDITSGTLIYQLVPILDTVIKQKKSIKILATGNPPRRRFTVTVL